MIIKDLAEIPSEEILCLLNMEVRKKYVFGTCTCPFFVCWVFLQGGYHKQSMDNQSTGEAKRRACKLFYPSHDLNDKWYTFKNERCHSHYHKIDFEFQNYHAYPQRFPRTVACFCYGKGPEQIPQCQGFVKYHILLWLQWKVQSLLC